VRHRSLLALGSAAILVAACGAPETAPPADEPTVDDTATAATCTNEDVGYAVEYPDGWHVNDGEVLPACSAFDPEPVAIPDRTDIPTDIAVVIRGEPIAFADLSDPAGDPGVTVQDRQDLTIDGRSAVALELEATGEGMYPEGHVLHRYVVEVNADTSLVAETHDVEAATPSFDERRDILDEMVRSLTFSEA
jgi:hypothetical protein